MSSEIERKFLLPEAPARLSEAKAVRIEQGYLAIEGGGRGPIAPQRGGTPADGKARRLTVVRGCRGVRNGEALGHVHARDESAYPGRR